RGLRLRSRVSAPNFRSVLGTDRYDIAAEGAARIDRIGAGVFFLRSNRHVQSAVVQNRRTCDARESLVVELLLPDQLSVGIVDRVEVRFEISEVHPIVRTDDGRATD